MAEINGRTYDFSDVRARVGGQNFKLQAISYKLNREIGKPRDNSPKKVFRTRGFIDPDGSMRLHLHDLDLFLAALAGVSPTGGFLDATFEVTVTFGTNEQPTVTHKLIGCTLMDVDSGHEAGSDGLSVELPLDIMDIDYAGKKGFPDA